MSVTDLDVSALVHLAYRIREDTHGLKPWDRQGTHVIFTRELKGMHLPTAVEIVIRHASDPEAKTPAAITRPFLPAAPPAHRLRKSGPPRKHEECPTHAGQYADNCGGCNADALAGDDRPEPAEDLASQILPNHLTGPDAVRVAAGLPPRGATP